MLRGKTRRSQMVFITVCCIGLVVCISCALTSVLCPPAVGGVDVVPALGFYFLRGLPGAL